MTKNMWAFFASIDPRAPYVALAVIVGFIVWLWRRVHSKSFDALPSLFKATVGMLLATIIALPATVTDAEIVQILKDTLFTSLSGLMASGGHEWLRRLPTALFDPNKEKSGG